MSGPSSTSRQDLERRVSIPAWVLIAPIRFYQRFITPYTPATCRYYPTCSSYAVTALREHGAVRGLWLTVRRLGRCHPWSSGGVDHVPAHVPRRVRALIPIGAGTEDQPGERHQAPVRSPGAAVPAVIPAGQTAPPTDRSNAA